MKKCSLFLIIYGMILMSSGASVFYSSATMQRLDDDALSTVVGQRGAIQTATDPHPLNEYHIMNALNKSRAMGQEADLNLLKSAFFVNEFGQTVLQINQDVVSIGTIEFRLHIDGLRDLGNMLAEQLQLN